MFWKNKSDFYICRCMKGVAHALYRKSLWWYRVKTCDLQAPVTGCGRFTHLKIPPANPGILYQNSCWEYLGVCCLLIPFQGMGCWILLLPKFQPARCKAGPEVCSHTLKVISYKSSLMKITKLNFKKLGPCFPEQLCASMAPTVVFKSLTARKQII